MSDHDSIGENRAAGGISGGRRTALFCLPLFLLVVATFFPALHNEFVGIDDPEYVTANLRVQHGLTQENLSWAFRTTTASNWHPVTWLSHMLDCQIFGLQPWGHHLTSILVHAINTILVFLVLQRMTGATWRSFLAAALFGLHPLHVESVVWVAERKDVLSTFFGLLTLWAYAEHARKSKAQNHASRVEPSSPRSDAPPSRESRAGMSTPALHARWATPDYVLALLFFALGLMTKPMLVTLPFVLLLLDYWPLERGAGFTASADGELKNAPNDAQAFGLRRLSAALASLVRRKRRKSADESAQSKTWRLFIRLIGKLVLEKLPFFVLAAGSCVVALIAQQRGGAVTTLDRIPLGLRLENAVVSYGRYLGKLFYPVDLAVYYPYPDHWPVATVSLACVAFAVLSVLAVALRRRHPYLPVGWFWFIGSLVPVIGLVQVGEQAMADRYSYFPALGIFIMVSWGLAEVSLGGARLLTNRIAERVFQRKERLAGTLAPLSARSKTPDLVAAEVTRLESLRKQQRKSESPHVGCYIFNGLAGKLQALVSLAAIVTVVVCIFLTRKQIGYWRDSETLFQHAIAVTTNNYLARDNLGTALGAKGKIDESIQQYREALRIKPDFAEAHNNLGAGLVRKGQLAGAVREFVESLRLNPDLEEGHYNLGCALSEGGRIQEAIAEFQRAVSLKPDHAVARYNLANMLRRSGRLDEAISQYLELLKLDPGYAEAYYNLGVVLAGRGRLDEAVVRFSEFLKRRPNSVETHYNLGLIFEKQGSWDEAIKEFQEALRLRPGHTEARTHLDAVLGLKKDLNRR